MLKSASGKSMTTWLAAVMFVMAMPAMAQPADLAIVGVNLLDVETGEIRPDRVILVEDGRIKAIQQREAGTTPEAKRRVEHEGAFALPGLWDMHVHFRGGEALREENEAFLDRYLGYGITGVRDAGGDLADAVARWRSEIATGGRRGPVIFTPLLKLDGKGGRWPGSIAVESPRDIAMALEGLEAGGADYIKIYDSTIDPGLYLETLRRAEARDLLTSAHLPFSVPFAEAIDAGLDSIEHALYLHKAASPRDQEISMQIRQARESGDRSGLGNPFERLMDTEDLEHARTVISQMAEAGMALTPTLYIDRLLRFLDEDPHTQDPELAHIPQAIRETYRGRIESAAARTAEQIASDHERVARTMALAELAHDAGVRILAGSDAGAYNSYVYPGDSLHRELALLVKAGLTPLEALQAATINGAAFLGVDDEYGTLSVGKAADILILKADPTADIANTRAVAGLVRAGRYLSGTRLEALKTRMPEE